MSNVGGYLTEPEIESELSGDDKDIVQTIRMSHFGENGELVESDYSMSRYELRKAVTLICEDKELVGLMKNYAASAARRIISGERSSDAPYPFLGQIRSRLDFMESRVLNGILFYIVKVITSYVVVMADSELIDGE